MKHTSFLFGFVAAAALIAVPVSTVAQLVEPRVSLQPHCEEENRADCPSFEVIDPETVTTQPLREGDTLDIDIVFRNTAEKTVTRARTWLAYDPNLLEGISPIEANEDLELQTPGELDFDPNEGFVKIELSTEGDGVSDQQIVIARVQFRVTEVSKRGGTAISLYDVQPEGHTDIEAGEESLLTLEPGVLLVTFASGEKEEAEVQEETEPEQIDTQEEEPVQQEPSPLRNGSLCEQDSDCQSGNCTDSICSAAATESDTSTLDMPTSSSTFSLLQTRNVRVSTEGNNVYLAWDALPSSSLKAYNIYYGTVSGQYLQRKTVPGEATSHTIRSLPTGTVYYFSVRGVDVNDEESAFAQEVSITIGDPLTATAPLTRKVPSNLPPPGNPIRQGPYGQEAFTVPGATGTSANLMLFFAGSALIGTFFAWRRQRGVSSHPHS